MNNALSIMWTMNRKIQFNIISAKALTHWPLINSPTCDGPKSGRIEPVFTNRAQRTTKPFLWWKPHQLNPKIICFSNSTNQKVQDCTSFHFGHYFNSFCVQVSRNVNQKSDFKESFGIIFPLKTKWTTSTWYQLSWFLIYDKEEISFLIDYLVVFIYLNVTDRQTFTQN